MPHASKLTLPKTMAAVVCHAPDDYRPEEVRLPTPGAGQALLRVYGVGICAGDLFHKDCTIVGSIAACHTFQPTIAWLANGVIDVEPLVCDAVPWTRSRKLSSASPRGMSRRKQAKLTFLRDQKFRMSGYQPNDFGKLGICLVGGTHHARLRPGHATSPTLRRNDGGLRGEE